MKHLLIWVILVNISSSFAFGAWAGKVTKLEKDESGTGLVATVEVTDGMYSETLVRPMFRPKAVGELKTTTENLITEVKSRKEAIDAVNIVYPEMQKEINKVVAEKIEVK